jgi:3-hydroxyisobutyrate dehydrogenase-like beta-hydroxyacid dehydrogenase
MSTRIGFVGLGQIGGAMALRLSRSVDVLARDADPDAHRRLPQLQTATAEEITRECGIVFLSLPNGTACRLAIADLGARDDDTPGLIVDLSTIGPTAAEACAEDAAKLGWRYLDAPVSGGVSAATQGALSIMLAGAPEDIALAGPIVARIADKPFIVGDTPGLGQAMKLVNNAIALSVLPLTSEALTFGVAHGLELSEMLDVINASSGRTQRSEGMFLSSIVTGSFDHGATGEITKKDMELFVEEASQVGSPIRIADVVSNIYGEFVEAHPKTDYSFLHDHIARSRNGAEEA